MIKYYHLNGSLMNIINGEVKERCNCNQRFAPAGITTLRKLCFHFYHIRWDMIVVIVFLSILNQMDFYLVQNRMENCHHNHIPFNVRGNGN